MSQLNSRSGSRPSRSRQWVLLAAGVFALIALGSVVATARPTAPSARDRQITLAVSMLMEQRNLSGHRLDDTISQRTLDTFIKELDPLKLFLLQKDVDEFSKNRDHLDDFFKRGDINFAYTMFGRFLSRVEERVKTAQAALAAQHDFSVDENMDSDPKVIGFATTPEEAAERWRRRVKFDLLKEIADDVSMDEAVKKLHKRYDSIRKSWEQTDNDELLERYLTALTTSFDPHSSYMSPTTQENFEIQMRLQLEGIGASLRGLDGYTVVQSIIPGGAADKQGGLKTEDKIIGVGQGTDGPFEDIVDMKLNEVVKKIRGKRGTIVRLQVDPADGAERKELTITRDKIELRDSEARSEVIQRGKKADGTPYNLGVIQLPSFYMDMEGARMGLPNFKSTTRDVRRLLEQFQKQGNIDAVVIDLRWNGGGSLTEARDMTGLFIDKGPVVQVKDLDGRITPYNDIPETGFVWKGPLVVMINKFSASASEIFAGAIQDYGRGIVIGDRATHGKGTVQQLFDLDDRLFPMRQTKMGALKLTIQHFYLPDGFSTQTRGVVSDLELPSLTTHLDVSESDLDYSLEFDKVKPLPHDRYGMVDAKLLEGLRQRSLGRVTGSEFFGKSNRQIERYQQQKERKSVTLNKEQFLKERAELNAEKEEEDIYEDLSNPNRPVFEMDGYGEEALDITVDYLDLLGANKIAVAQPNQPQVGITQ